MRVPTLRDVAREAGVHPATASRALNAGTRNLVNAETALRVLRSAESLGYRPNPMARSLKTARSNSVGVVIPDLTNPLFPPMVRGVEDVLGPVGYSAWIVNTDNDAERERSQIESLRSRQVDGLVIATARLEHPLLEELHDDGLKMVLINRRGSSSDIPSVIPDDESGTAMAIEHLVELGHRRIAYVAGPQDTSTGTLRYQAYRDVLRNLGLEDDPTLVTTCAQWSEEQGAHGLRRLLDSGAPFTAVLAGNDLLALGCYDVCEERGIALPDELSIVGYNDITLMDKLTPPLTSVRVPHHNIGAEAARMLLETLQDPQRHPLSVLLPVRLMVRESSAPPPARRAVRRGRR